MQCFSSMISDYLDEGVAEPEGGGGELVPDAGVDVAPVGGPPKRGDGEPAVEEGEGPQDGLQPLPVDDILDLRPHDAAGVLVHHLGRHVRIDAADLDAQENEGFLEHFSSICV